MTYLGKGRRDNPSFCAIKGWFRLVACRYRIAISYLSAEMKLTSAGCSIVWTRLNFVYFRPLQSSFKSMKKVINLRIRSLGTLGSLNLHHCRDECALGRNQNFYTNQSQCYNWLYDENVILSHLITTGFYRIGVIFMWLRFCRNDLFQPQTILFFSASSKFHRQNFLDEYLSPVLYYTPAMESTVLDTFKKSLNDHETFRT